VIDRRPDDGEAERHVDRPAEREQLHRNQALVVVAGNHGVELAARGASEDRVAGKRAVDFHASRARLVHRGPQHAGLLGPEQPLLAGVRIQSRERDARARDAEARQLARGQVDDFGKERRREQPGHIRERDVHRREDDLQRVGPEHHGDAGRVREVRQQVRVPLPLEPRTREPQLVDRCRGDRGDAAGHRVADGRADRLVRREARVGGQHARLEPGAVRRAVDHGLTGVADARMIGRLLRDLRTDARGIARRNRDDWFPLCHQARASGANGS